MSPAPRIARAVARLATGIAVAALTALGLSLPAAAPAGAASTRVVAVGAENEYADVISQIGGPYVSVRAVMSNPNTDPHTFESSPSVAREVAGAQLVVQNGLGYDTFMNRIESASPDPRRKVIDVQTLLGLPDSTKNPHLWYGPQTMPKVAAAIATDLDALEPAHRATFQADLERFDASLATWRSAIAALKTSEKGAAVATTEPVADDLLQAAGIDNRTPWSFQADVMNGVDPSPQDVATEEALLSDRKVKALVYNRQVTDSLTASLLTLAHQHHVPVVGVYETMPTPGYTYQSWMEAEVAALKTALAHGTSAPKL